MRVQELLVKTICATDLISPLSLANICICFVSGRTGSFFCLIVNHCLTVIVSLTAEMKPREMTTPDKREVTVQQSDVSETRDEVGRTGLRGWFNGPVPL